MKETKKLTHYIELLQIIGSIEIVNVDVRVCGKSSDRISLLQSVRTTF